MQYKFTTWNKTYGNRKFSGVIIRIDDVKSGFRRHSFCDPVCGFVVGSVPTNKNQPTREENMKYNSTTIILNIWFRWDTLLYVRIKPGQITPFVALKLLLRPTALSSTFQLYTDYIRQAFVRIVHSSRDRQLLAQV